MDGRAGAWRTANTGLDPTQASVTEIVTHVAQHDAIGRNMARYGDRVPSISQLVGKVNEAAG